MNKIINTFLSCILFAGASYADNRYHTYNAGGSDLETLYTFGLDTPPGNIAATRQGRIFISVHDFYATPENPADFRVMEIVNGVAKPYPTPEISRSLNPVLGVVADTKGILWILETATGLEHSGRLIGWDIKKDELFKEIYIAAPNIPVDSFLNDLAVDRTNDAIYITDTAGANTSALIVVDIQRGTVRRVLNNSPFTRAENIPMVIDGRNIFLGGEPAQIGANPITIDHRNEWVYFAPMTAESLYRIRTRDLLNPYLNDEQLRSRVQVYGEKPISDGITIDNRGNVYITDITNNAIGFVNRDGEYQILHQDPELLSWPDGFTNLRGGQILATVNQLHRSPVLNDGVDGSTGTFRIVRFSALARTRVGR